MTHGEAFMPFIPADADGKYRARAIETVRQARELIEDRYSWRPDTRLELLTDESQSSRAPWVDAALLVKMKVRDAYDPTNPRLLLVTHRRGFPLVLPTTEWSLICRIRQELQAVDRHEGDEWIRVDGEMIFNPHKND